MATPTTSWIQDSGVVIETTTDVLIDELGNFFVDEFGNNLLDSTSTDGESLAHGWNAIPESITSWADSFEARISEVTLTTAHGDTRSTVQGDNRTMLTSSPNIQTTTSWSIDEY